MATLTLESRGIDRANGMATLAWVLHADGQGPFTLAHAVEEEHAALLTQPARGDHALVVALLHAMRHRLDIRVEGEVSPRLLDGLETLQTIWGRWAPERYAPVSITAAREAAPPVPPPGAGGLFAFSGGVDAAYTFFKHLHGAAGRATCPPAAALLVHGMDIPLDRPEAFLGALARVRRMLDGTGVPAITIRTNCRQLSMDWEQSYGLQLTACFLAFQGSFVAGLKGSSEPYEHLVMPWGSTPLTDPLGSTESMRIVHDGCEASRSEKVDWLVTHSRACEDLRVCWEGPALDRNCGRCEKCVRTMLNFWCLGHAVPAAFPEPLTPERVATLTPRNAVQRAELESILRLAEIHRPADPILTSLRGALRRATTHPARKGPVQRLEQVLKARLSPGMQHRFKALKRRLKG